jgi:hypothetical protein
MPENITEKLLIGNYFLGKIIFTGSGELSTRIGIDLNRRII